jgi:integrase/recombinase XerD
MSLLAPTLQAFFAERQITQLNASPHTIASYRDTFRLLLRFAHEQTGKPPFELDLDDLDAPLIGAFLTHLELDRGNSPRTRNNRLAAIHSLYAYAGTATPRAPANDRPRDGDPSQTLRAPRALRPEPRRDQSAARRRGARHVARPP